LENEGFKFPITKLDFFVIPVKEEMINKSLQITQKLRSLGASTDIDLMRRGVAKSLKYASSLNVKKTILIGPDELQDDSITIRNMDTGKQKMIKINDINKIIE
jgi:histidyl-tRNA synthetase